MVAGRRRPPVGDVSRSRGGGRSRSRSRAGCGGPGVSRRGCVCRRRSGFDGQGSRRCAWRRGDSCAIGRLWGCFGTVVVRSDAGAGPCRSGGPECAGDMGGVGGVWVRVCVRTYSRCFWIRPFLKSSRRGGRRFQGKNEIFFFLCVCFSSSFFSIYSCFERVFSRCL